MIKAIVFDMGGVLVDLDIEACLKAFREKAGFVRVGEFFDPCHQKGFVLQLESGEITEDEFYDICRGYCAPGTDNRTIYEGFVALLVGIEPYKVDLLRELSGRYPIYMLSNNNPIGMRRSRELFAEAGIPMDEIFRELFVSCEMKLLKPGLEIFREAVRRIGLKPDEILFLDDSPRNVAGAAAAGMRAVHYVQGTDLRETIDKALENN